MVGYQKERESNRDWCNHFGNIAEPSCETEHLPARAIVQRAKITCAINLTPEFEVQKAFKKLGVALICNPRISTARWRHGDAGDLPSSLASYPGPPSVAETRDTASPRWRENGLPKAVL